MQNLKFILIINFFFMINMCFFSSQKLQASPFSQDGLLIQNSYEDFSGGYMVGTDPIKNENGFITISSEDTGYKKEGKYFSKIIKMDFYPDEVFPSWNITCPENEVSFKIYLRVSSDNINWSAWYYMGSSGVFEKENNQNKILKDDYGKVDIDTLYLNRKVNYIQYCIHMFSSKDRQLSPALKLFAIAYGKRSENFKENLSSDQKNETSYIKLNVPYRSQGDEDTSISGSICSPTSVAMVMEYWGVDIPTEEIAHMAYSKEYDMYGIWPAAVQTASLYGLRGWVRIFKNWEDVEKEILNGRPVIATICFDWEELSGSFTPASDGHVIVICGFDNNGNPICNDPAGKNSKEGILVYSRKELERAWFWESGIGYTIFKE